MSLVTDLIALQQAGLAREVTPPSPPLAYGIDLSCVTDVDDKLTTVDPNSALGIAQSLIRRLTCPRGALADDQNYGTDVHAMLNRGVGPTGLQSYESQIRGECAKDDRVESTDVSVVLLTLKLIRIRIQVTPVDPALADFEFVFSVDDTAALLESIR